MIFWNKSYNDLDNNKIEILLQCNRLSQIIIIYSQLMTDQLKYLNIILHRHAI